jgi:hypothetical protein
MDTWNIGKWRIRFCDAISYHNYTIEKLGFPNDASEKGYEKALSPIKEKLGTIPKDIWMTEGLSTMIKNGAGFYNYTIPYESFENIIDTSDELCRYVISHLRLNVKKIFLYSMHCHSYFPDEALIQFRAILTEEGSLHPSGTAYSNMAWHLEDTNFVKGLTLTEGVYAYIFEGKNKAIAVISPQKEHKEYMFSFEKNIQIRDLFGNPFTEECKLEDTLVYIKIEGSAEKLIEI